MKSKVTLSEVLFFTIIILMFPLAILSNSLLPNYKSPEVSAHDLPLWQYMICPEEFSIHNLKEPGFNLIGVDQTLCIYKNKKSDALFYYPWSRIFLKNIYLHLSSSDPKCSSHLLIKDDHPYLRYACG